MEMLIAGIENRDIVCGSRDEPKDVAEWIGVSFQGGCVIAVNWWFCHLLGRLDAEYMPATIVDFQAGYNKLKGNIDFAQPSDAARARVSSDG